MIGLAGGHLAGDARRWRTFGWATSAAPQCSPSPVITLKTPGGKMSAASSASSQRGERRQLGRLEHHGAARPPAPGRPSSRPSSSGSSTARSGRRRRAARGAASTCSRSRYSPGAWVLETAGAGGEEAEVVDEELDLGRRDGDRLADVLALDAAPARRCRPRWRRRTRMQRRGARGRARRSGPARRRRRRRLRRRGRRRRRPIDATSAIGSPVAGSITASVRPSADFDPRAADEVRAVGCVLIAPSILVADGGIFAVVVGKGFRCDVVNTQRIPLPSPSRVILRRRLMCSHHRSGVVEPRPADVERQDRRRHRAQSEGAGGTQRSERAR